MNTNALTTIRQELPAGRQDEQSPTIAEMQCLINELVDRVDYLEMQAALNPARRPMTLWQWLKRRVQA